MWPGKGVSRHFDAARHQPVHKGGASAALRSGSRSQIPKRMTAGETIGSGARAGPSQPPALAASHKGPRHHPSAPPAGTCSSRSLAKPQRRKRPDYNSQQPPRPSPAPLPPSWLRSEPPFSLPPPLKSPPPPPRADAWSRLFVSALRPDVRPLQSNRGRVGKPEAETQERKR
ncbi:atherin-like [Myotis daubentonii]|uniref:atherin-like n=1 Tax=Myotis daubentonii TaxID=98922 RepID=UPI00287363DA|nr:atherin-like [Myotis daubentonii]